MNETPTPEAPRKRLDQRVAPGWANLCTNLLRGGGILVGALLIWLGFLTGGFFLVLTGVLGAIAIIGGWVLGGLIQRESWYTSSAAQAKSYALAIGFPIALLVFAQVAGPLLTPVAQRMQCFAETLTRSQERHDALAVDPRLTEMQFIINVREIEGGAVRWFVTDPVGQSQWSGRTDQAGYTETHALPPSGGQWTVNVISEADSVTYAIDWQAGNPGNPMFTPPEACARPA